MDESEKYNDILGKNAEDNAIDFDSLEGQLESELEDKLSELKFLESEREQIGNPDALGEIIKNVVWEQFIKQVAVTAGEDFIKENNGLNLDLSPEAHIQTTENFANGNIATHNTEINYQSRYDEWQKNFPKDENGNIITHTDRSGKEKARLVTDARKPFDSSRPSGSAKKHTAMDHTISAAEIIRDPAANAHLRKEEQIAFANSDTNLYEMDASLNCSKGDKSTTEWLDNPNSNGQKPKDIFDISDEEDRKMRQKDAEAREEYENLKKKGEERSIKTGKESQKKEAFRIGGKALRAVAMQLLSELVKEMIGKLVKWFKEQKKNLNSLIESLKSAIKSFIGKLKTHIINAGNTLVTTISTAIIGPVVGTITKVWMILKQGWQSLKEAIAFLTNPANKTMPMSIKVLEVGKIVVAGLSGVGALVLGDVIEKGLMTIPAFAFQIPLLGSLANIIGIFMGAVVSGIIGAIVINLIDKATAKRRRELSIESQIDKGNEILRVQHKLFDVTAEKYAEQKAETVDGIKARHIQACEIMQESVNEIYSNKSQDHSIDFDEMDSALDKLLE